MAYEWYHLVSAIIIIIIFVFVVGLLSYGVAFKTFSTGDAVFSYSIYFNLAAKLIRMETETKSTFQKHTRQAIFFFFFFIFSFFGFSVDNGKMYTM